MKSPFKKFRKQIGSNHKVEAAPVPVPGPGPTPAEAPTAPAVPVPTATPKAIKKLRKKIGENHKQEAAPAPVPDPVQAAAPTTPKAECHVAPDPEEYEERRRNTSGLEHNEIALLPVGTAPETEYAYDIAGTWRLLYKHDNPPAENGISRPLSPKIPTRSHSAPMERESPVNQKEMLSLTPGRPNASRKRSPIASMSLPPISPSPTKKSPRSKSPKLRKSSSKRAAGLEPEGQVARRIRGDESPGDSRRSSRTRDPSTPRSPSSKKLAKKSPKTPSKSSRKSAPRRSSKKSPRSSPKTKRKSSKNEDQEDPTMDVPPPPPSSTPPSPMMLDPTMTILIQNWDGKILQLDDVTPDNVLEDVTGRIEQIESIPKKEQRLFLGEKELFNHQSTLADNHIRDGDTLRLALMDVIVQHWSGTEYTLRARPDETIDTLQKRIAKETRIPKQQQRLFFKGASLMKMGSHFLRECGIHHQSVLDLEPMEIHVHTITGKKHTFTVDPNHTIASIKARVFDKLLIPIDEQRITFASVLLEEDGITLTEYNIGHGDNLYLQPMAIFVKHWNGTKYTMDVTPDTIIEDIQVTLGREHHIPKLMQRLSFKKVPLKEPLQCLRECNIQHRDTIHLDPMEIIFRTPKGETFTIIVEPDDDVESIKRKVEEKTGIPASEQRIRHKGRPLVPGTLKDNGVEHGDTLDIDPMQINIRESNGKMHVLDVNPSDIILEVKEKIHDKTSIPKKNQKLRFHKRSLKDKKMLQDYDIKHDDTLDLEWMEIYVKHWNGTKYTMEVTPDTIVEDIQVTLGREHHIPKLMQRLSFKKVPLKDPSRSLRECNIQHRDTIHLVPMEIIFRTPLGETFKITVEPDDDVESIKKKVEKKTGIPAAQQRIRHKGRPLVPGTLKDNGIEDGDILDIDPMRINVREANGKMHVIDVNPSDVILEVKEKIHDKTSIPKKNQKLRFHKRSLKDKKTLQDYDIKHDDTLDLEWMEIYVKHWDGTKYTMEVTPDTIIEDIQITLGRVHHIPKLMQRLSFKKVPLKDPSRSLRECNIQHRDTIHLVPMEIIFRNSIGDTFKIIVEPDDDVESIKKKVEEKTGIPASEQRIRHRGRPLVPGTLKDNGIEDGDILDIDPMQINVRESNGKTHVIDVDPSDVILEVKEKIHSKTSIPQKHQFLHYKQQPVSEDRKTLRDYTIKHDDTLELQPMTLNVLTPNGDSFGLLVNPLDDADVIREKIMEKTKTPKDQQRISHRGTLIKKGTIDSNRLKHRDTLVLEPLVLVVRDVIGHEHKVVVHPGGEVADIKTAIEKIAGIPNRNQRLRHKGNPLRHYRQSLKDCNIRHGDVIDLDPMEIQILTPDGNTLKIITAPMETIQDVHTKIEELTSIPVEDQRLLLHEKPLLHLKETLAECGIQDGDTLDMQPMEIFVIDLNGETHAITVEPSDRIGQIKTAIEDRTGTSKQTQRLFHADKQLDDDMTSLSTQGIKHQDTLHLQPMTVYVTDVDNGKEHTLVVMPTDSVKKVKDQMQLATGIPKNARRLTFQGKDLDDDSKTLPYYDVKHEDTLGIEPVYILIEKPDSTLLKLPTKPSDTIKDVKDLIEKSEGIPPKEQVLTFNKEELENDPTLDDYGINHGSTLKLQLKPNPVRRLTPIGPIPTKATAKKEPNPDIFGQVTITSYKTDYSGDNDESFLVEKIGEETEKYKINKCLPHKSTPKQR